jgi:hypothetical protein
MIVVVPAKKDRFMADVSWSPEQSRPVNAARLEDEIRHVAPGAQVKLTFRDGEWLVRALLPSAMCPRGADLSARDVSAVVAEVLADHDLPARVFSQLGR